MRRVLIGLVGCLLVAVEAYAQLPLFPNRLATRSLPESTAVVLFNGDEGFFVDVPPDAIRVVLDLSTSPPEAAVDLFARFGEDVRLTATDTVLADYRSEGPTGTERIEITPASAPPLQPGRYFVAMRAGPNGPGAYAFLRVIIETPVVTDVVEIVRSDFEGSADGWDRNFPEPVIDVPGFSMGDPASVFRTNRDATGDRSRYLEIESQGDDYFVVGRQFLGNLTLLGADPRIEFDLRFRPPQSFANQDVEIKIFSRFTTYRWSAGRPLTDFTHYSVSLHSSAFQLISGSDSFERVLENVLRIEIRANYGQPGGLTALDNVVLYGRPTAPDAPLVSTFDTSAQGWTRNFPEAPFLSPRAFGVTSGDQETTVRVLSTDGNPGGHLQITDDNDDANQDFLLAPVAFLGDLAALGPGAAFEFDRRQQSSFGVGRSVEVRIIGFGAAYRYLGPPASREWSRHRAALTPDMWTLVEGERSFQQTLRAVQRIEVSVDDVVGGEITGFDNFRLAGIPSEVPVVSVAPGSLAFVAVLGAGESAAQVVEVTSGNVPASWAVEVTGGASWIDLERTDGDTPGALLVRVNPAGLNRGVYTDTIEVAWTGAPAPLTIPVRLTVIDSTTPRINLSGIVNNATFTGNALPGGELSGGMFVAIFGERLASGTAQAETVPFPASLAGTSVTMGGLPARLVYVSPTQIVCVTPQALTQINGIAQGGPATSADVVVTRGGDASPIETVRLKPVQPLIFTQNQSGTGLGAIQNVLGGGQVELNTFDTPARPGQAVTIFTTGLGPTATPVPDGFAASGANPITGQTQVTIGSNTGTPLFTGLSPNSPHLYQVNATVPNDSPVGCAVSVRINVNGVASNEVTLAVTADGAPCR
jgi:uncharacterized protein (TIGR03437 family)